MDRDKDSSPRRPETIPIAGSQHDPTRIGPYRILEKLGEGGMGEVFLAEQQEPIRRRVALKVIKLGMDTKEVIARFESERQALAIMNHANVAKVFDAGVTDQGRPFFVMEHVPGIPITDYCDRHRLNMRERLHLFVSVCHAIHHAHQKGIIHRDIKPSNVLVAVQDEKPVPKVIDFGVAKAVDQRLTEHTYYTQIGRMIGTPAYMSPEQAEMTGLNIDATTDVYSLGVLLYELLVGALPFDPDELSDVGPEGIHRVIREVDPRTPSSRVSTVGHEATAIATRRHTIPHSLARQIRGELDWITMRAMEKDRTRRYESALEFASDIERHLCDEPVRACPPSAAYRTQKFLRRHRARVGLVAVGALVILAFLWQHSRTEREIRSAQVAASETSMPHSDRLMTVVFPFENLGPAEDAYFAAGVTDEINSRLAVVSGLGVVSRTSATQYDRAGKTMGQIREDLGVDYVLEGTVRWARAADGRGRVRITPQLSSVADDMIVWSETYDREIHDIFAVQSEIAAQVIEKLGVTLLGPERERLEERPTDNLEAYEAYLKAQDFTGYAWVAGDQDIVALYERAIALDPSFLNAWVSLCTHHALVYSLVERTEERLSKAEAALRGAEAVDSDDPWTRWARGIFFYHGSHDYEQALAEFTAAASGLPNNATAQRSIGWILRRQGKFEACIVALEKAHKLDPRDINHLLDLGLSFQGLRQFEKAEGYYRQALAINPEHDGIRIAAFSNALSRTGDLAQARSLLRQEPGDNPVLHAIAWFALHAMEGEWAQALSLVETEETGMPTIRMLNLYARGVARAGLGESDAAGQEFAAAARAGEQVVTASPTDAGLREVMSLIYARLGRDEEAIREAMFAVDLSAKDRFAGPHYLENLAKVYVITGNPDKAFELIDRLLTMQYEDAITTNRLRLDPDWAPLQEDPRYKDLLN